MSILNPWTTWLDASHHARCYYVIESLGNLHAMSKLRRIRRVSTVGWIGVELGWLLCKQTRILRCFTAQTNKLFISFRLGIFLHDLSVEVWQAVGGLTRISGIVIRWCAYYSLYSCWCNCKQDGWRYGHQWGSQEKSGNLKFETTAIRIQRAYTKTSAYRIQSPHSS